MEGLARIDARLGQMVETRYSGGIEDAEITAAMGLSMRTVCGNWDEARLLPAHALQTSRRRTRPA